MKEDKVIAIIKVKKYLDDLCLKEIHYEGSFKQLQSLLFSTGFYWGFSKKNFISNHLEEGYMFNRWIIANLKLILKDSGQMTYFVGSSRVLSRHLKEEYRIKSLKGLILNPLDKKEMEQLKLKLILEQL